MNCCKFNFSRNFALVGRFGRQQVVSAGEALPSGAVDGAIQIIAVIVIDH